MTDVDNAQPRVSLAQLPTPLHPLPRLTEALGGPQLYIKRDDLTGLATGGNKSRKLEFLMAAAQREGADCVITAGGPQSNHCRQTAAAAAQLGMKCHLVIGGPKDSPVLGNLLLDVLLDATLHFTAKEAREETMTRLAADMRAQGRVPYVIPVGGSNGVGALGFVAAFFELTEQMRVQGLTFDRIVFASSSGGTQAGLMLGAALCGFRGSLLGISIDNLPDEVSESKYREAVVRIANESAQLLGYGRRFEAREVLLNYDYLGGGYGVLGERERQAILRLARSEGILLGPVYTGRAFGALLDAIQRRMIEPHERVLFWHTGDETALHGYASELVAR